MKPLCIELFAGLSGWGEGFGAEGYRVVGFDLFDMPKMLGEARPGGDIRLVLQDVLTLHGSQFRDAACIVASPPCQAYSYIAMPWSRAKRRAEEIRADASGERLATLNALFDACFRIQREASAAAGRHIPLVVENVKGAQLWVGRAAWHYGSFYLWGDVPALMPMIVRCIKGPGGDWFQDGRQGQDACAAGLKTINHVNVKNGFSHTRNLTNQRESDGVKQHGSGAAWFDKALDARRRDATAIKNGKDWFGAGENCSLQRRSSSGSNSRKAASAQIAKIPFALAQHLARCFRPTMEESCDFALAISGGGDKLTDK